MPPIRSLCPEGFRLLDLVSAWTGLPSVRSCWWHSHICFFRLCSHIDDAHPRLMLVRSVLVQGATSLVLQATVALYWQVRQLSLSMDKDEEAAEETVIFSFVAAGYVEPEEHW